MKNNEESGAFGTYGGRGEVCIGLWWGSVREKDHLADLGIDARMLKWVFKKWGGRLGLE
jgi:hypothetical protein